MPSDIPGGGTAAAIPEELLARPQWVGWRAVERDGKSTKVPVNPATGGMASATDYHTWATFEQALTGARAGEWDGIGFVFSPDDPYCGIDLDDVIDTATGEIDPDAMATVERFQSYAELSPSGSGIHIIVKATPPGGAGRKRADRECYSQGRFFTVTAKPLNDWAWVASAQEELTRWHAETFPEQGARPATQVPPRPLDLSDGEIVDKIRRSKQGEKFGRLWEGDTAGYASGSEADLALCSILAWWTQGNPDAVDRLFRSSELMRTKWDAKRGDSTYGGRTVARAVATTAGGYDPEHTSGPTPVIPPWRANTDPNRRFRWSSELTGPASATDWLWHGYLPRGGITLLSAYWKSGKTTLLSHLLGAFATGGEFCGKAVQPCRVLYVSEEGERLWVMRRDKLGLGDHVGFYLQPFASRPNADGWAGFIGNLIQDVKNYGFELVVFDTLAKLWPVAEENNAGEVDGALMPLWELTKAGAGVLLIHHMRKSGGQEYTSSRGSGALSAFPDTLIELTRFEPGNSKDRKRVLKAKGRYDETPDELVIELTDTGYLAVPQTADPQPVIGTPLTPILSEEERVVAVLTQVKTPWVTADGIREGLRANGWGIRDEDVSTILGSLFLRGMVRLKGRERSKTDPKKYGLASRVDDISFPPSHSDPGCQRERDGGNEMAGDEVNET